MSAPPIDIRGLDHVVIRVASLAPMLSFYEGVLGLELIRSNESLGLYQLRAGASLIDLVPIGSQLGGTEAPRAEYANMAHVCLRLNEPNWDELLAYLREHGLEPGEPGQRFGADGNGPSVYIQDPEGNVVELKGEPV